MTQSWEVVKELIRKCFERPRGDIDLSCLGLKITELRIAGLCLTLLSQLYGTSLMVLWLNKENRSIKPYFCVDLTMTKFDKNKKSIQMVQNVKIFLHKLT